MRYARIVYATMNGSTRPAPIMSAFSPVGCPASSHGDREQPVAEAVLEAGDVAPEHHALEERGGERSHPEEPVPQLALPALGLHAEFERHAAQHESHEHRDHRDVERGEHDAMG